jgi:hypothetical protein
MNSNSFKVGANAALSGAAVAVIDERLRKGAFGVPSSRSLMKGGLQASASIVSGYVYEMLLQFFPQAGSWPQELVDAALTAAVFAVGNRFLLSSAGEGESLMRSVLVSMAAQYAANVGGELVFGDKFEALNMKGPSAIGMLPPPPGGSNPANKARTPDKVLGY